MRSRARHAAWIVLGALSVACPIGAVVVDGSSTSKYDVYAPSLPAYVAQNDTITDLELRVYVAAADSSSGGRVRVAPTCAEAEFSPSSFVYDEEQAVQRFSMKPFVSGRLTVEYLATDESESAAGSTALVTQTIEVLQLPKAFELSDVEWHGVILQNDSFDQPSTSNSSVYSSPLWSRLMHGYPSSACGSFDGNSALYFTSLGDRYATTAPLDLLGFHGKMHFHHIYGFRSVQSYDSVGDNLISCERVDAEEETVLSFLPPGQDSLNWSAWQQIYQVPLEEGDATTSTTMRTFSAHSVLLPIASMHAGAQFRWEQKNHSSFPLEVASGMTKEEILAAMNDDTGVNGRLGIKEQEVWRSRNLFDQWALDNVRLEVRLNVPAFVAQQDGVAGSTEVVVKSPIADSWVEFLVGNGTHKFPSCAVTGAGNRTSQSVVQLTASGYIHAVACLYVNASLISSFPARSPRFTVQARAPQIASMLDDTGGIDRWRLTLGCNGCDFMRYTLLPPPTSSDGEYSERDSPSCSFGTLIESSTYEVTVTENARLQLIACGRDLAGSEVVESKLFLVRPRAPTFAFEYPETTVSGMINVTIVPSVAASVGLVYSVGDNVVPPDCSEKARSGNVTIRVNVSDIVRAAACCIDRVCDDSEIAVWGPLNVSAVAPVFSMACSRTKPLTMVLEMRPVTTNAAIRYHIGALASPLTCSSGVVYTEPVEVSMASTTVHAVSCFEGLKASKQTEIPVFVDSCCAGLDAYKHPTCARLLLLEDDFSTSCADNSKWDKATSQWGGQDVNGGVHAGNVACSLDSQLGKNVLALSAHGDLFPAVSPVGRLLNSSDGSLRERTIDDGFLEWALDGASTIPCNQLERCPARRVGAAVSTKLKLNAGILLLRLKPCDAFGTLTQIWWGDYEEKEARTQQEVPFLPLWKAALYQAKTTASVPFALSSPRSTGFVEIAMQWNASESRANLYVDGALVLRQNASSGAARSLLNSTLSIGVWFPNAVAGEPLFQSCAVLVDRVQVFSMEIAGGRWCDFDKPGPQHGVSCESDRDCEHWVTQNCFMPIYEATCAAHNDELGGFTAHEAGEGGGASTAADTVATPPRSKFCHFRLEPSARSTVSATEMTAREQNLNWSVEEH